MRVTPENITEVNFNEIFVFGSNEAGHHGAGAARLALDKFGAVPGLGFGMAPNAGSFAIPTKNWYIQTLPLDVIEFYVNRFIEFARTSPHLYFLVTQIGCGLAGYTPTQIAPLFRKCLGMRNVALPESFIEILEPTRILSYDGDDLYSGIPDNYKDR